MDAEYINDTAQNILSIIRSGGPVTWSWGPESFQATAYKGMAALRFSVDGFVHKGEVVVAYNGGMDLFEVYCLGADGNVTASRDEVYFDELVDAIDQLVEKDCPDKEYDEKRRKWLEENPM
jgi:hypothetical protein